MDEFTIVFGALMLIALIIGCIVAAYVKAPPSTALIISGLKRTPRILIGQGGVRIPLIERMDSLFLGQISVDIKTETSVPTNDYINVNVDAVAKVMVGRDAESIQLASRNFLNFTAAEIAKDLQDSLEGNMREIIGTLTLEAINTDRDSFSDQVVEKAAQDMRKLGITVSLLTLVLTTPPVSKSVPQSLVQKQSAMLQSQRRRPKKKRMMPRFRQDLKLHSATLILLSGKQNSKKIRTSNVQKQMRLTRFSHRNSRRRFRPLPLTRRLQKRNEIRN